MAAGARLATADGTPPRQRTAWHRREARTAARQARHDDRGERHGHQCDEAALASTPLAAKRRDGDGQTAVVEDQRRRPRHRPQSDGAAGRGDDRSTAPVGSVAAR